MCFAYAAPSNSPYLKRLDIDPFETIQSEVSEFVGQGSLCILGDLNARTGSKPDYIPSEDNLGITAAQSSLYDTDSVGTFTKNNLDKVENSYGKKLLKLCSDTPMRILNGRKLGDLLGYYTCYRPSGSSVVDYALITPDLYDQVPVFSVLPFDPSVSDHTPVVLYLKVNSFVSYADTTGLLDKPKILNWDLSIKDRFQSMINSNICGDYLKSFVQGGIHPTVETVDSAVTF